jgi:hypothetical protein
MKTEKEKWLSRRLALKKYRMSEKNKIVQRRYQKKYRKELSAKALEWARLNRERINMLQRLRHATPEGKEIRRKISERYANKNRIKRLAKDKVHNALRAGRLTRLKCEVCGELKTEGHHPDYNQPLKVRWLCKKHHMEAHL